MATTMAKISKVAGRLLSHKLPRPISRSGSCGNGVRAEFLVDRFGVSGGSFYSSAAVPVESDLVGSMLFGLRDYRRALYGGIIHKALLVDAVGALVVPSQPKAQAWHLCDPDAEKVFKALRTSGVKLAVVSNFDTRLRPLLRALNCDHRFDAVAVSAEVEAEKPNPTIFLKACELLGVKPEDAVHMGDDRRNDIWGARDAGCDAWAAWLWGSDVQSFKELDLFGKRENGELFFVFQSFPIPGKILHVAQRIGVQV